MPATEHAMPICCHDLLNSLHATPQAAMLQQLARKTSTLEQLMRPQSQYAIPQASSAG